MSLPVQEPANEDVVYFNEILKAGVEAGCSDIHIKVGTPASFRISRAFHSIDFVPTQAWMQSVIDGICPRHMKAGLEAERETDFSYSAPGVGRFRTNVFQALGRWCIVMRYIKSVVPTFEKLGLPEVLKTVAESSRGIVLMAGTTGSGKSTTLAAMLEHLNNNFRKHIVTLEDPIEFVFEENQCLIEQRELNLDTMSFHRAMKSALREDPDVIMVGEMRDAVSFQTSISAADTGHTVISTMHTTSASSSVGRILEYFKQDERDTIRRQLASTLRSVCCQRMVPTAEGGMRPALEIMINTVSIRKAIEENQLGKLLPTIEGSQKIQEVEGLPMWVDQGEGMMSFNQCIFNMLQQGVITEERAMEKASNPQQLKMWMEGIFTSSGGITG
ncbi:MAG: PilT/PilU family type 4a pilus ATPase [Limisphaerales bacterium]